MAEQTPIRAAFFDIDGTLLSFTEPRRVPPSALCALAQMRAAGLRLFIASGRPPIYLAEVRRALPFRFDGYVRRRCRPSSMRRSANTI